MVWTLWKILVSWDDYSQYDGKVINFHGSSHQEPVMVILLGMMMMMMMMIIIIIIIIIKPLEWLSYGHPMSIP